MDRQPRTVEPETAVERSRQRPYGPCVSVEPILTATGDGPKVPGVTAPARVSSVRLIGPAATRCPADSSSTSTISAVNPTRPRWIGAGDDVGSDRLVGRFVAPSGCRRIVTRGWSNSRRWSSNTPKRTRWSRVIRIASACRNGRSPRTDRRGCGARPRSSAGCSAARRPGRGSRSPAKCARKPSRELGPVPNPACATASTISRNPTTETTARSARRTSRDLMGLIVLAVYQSQTPVVDCLGVIDGAKADARH